MKMTNREKKLLDYALVKAYHHDSGGKQSIYAIATGKNDRILAEAGNYYNTTHPVQSKYANIVNNHKQFLHAEIHVLIKLYRTHKEASKIFVARSNYKAEPLLAMPCPVCQLALKESGIKKIFHT
jgi:tRNA(Arg) A34 adenosine deaminase TadA